MLDKRWPEEGDPWTLRSVTRRFENEWFAVDAHAVTQPGGREGTYSVIRVRRLAVGVLPIEADGRVHLVGQWRFPLGRYSWEIPEGGAEPGEDAATCARRELQEETGLRAENLTPILEMDLSNSLTDERAVLFLATGLSQGASQPEEVEVLQRRTAPFADLLARVIGGQIRDSLTVAAVLRAHHMAVSGELPADFSRAMLGADR